MNAAESRGRMAPPVPEQQGPISPHALISPEARLGRGVEVGPFAVIGDAVELGDGCVLHAHAVVEGPSRIGRENVFYPFSSVGAAPQDRKYRGEATRLEVGDRNVFREFVTVNRGTADGAGVTRIGSDNLILAYSHIAHDCVVGSHTLFVNGATLAGHVAVEDYATVGAFCPVHQFCRIGRHAYIAANTVITQDVLPFSKTVAPRETRCYGVNTLGLERAGFSKERISAIEQAFRLLLRSKLNTSQAIEQIRAELDSSAEVRELVEFIGHPVHDSEDNAEKIGVAGERGETGLRAQCPLAEEAENPVVNEVHKLRPAPEFQARKIVLRDRGADKYHDHPDCNGKQIFHRVPVVFRIDCFPHYAPVCCS